MYTNFLYNCIFCSADIQIYDVNFYDLVNILVHFLYMDDSQTVQKSTNICKLFTCNYVCFGIQCLQISHQCEVLLLAPISNVAVNVSTQNERCMHSLWSDVYNFRFMHSKFSEKQLKCLRYNTKTCPVHFSTEIQNKLTILQHTHACHKYSVISKTMS